MNYCFDKFEKRLEKELAEYPKLITEDLLRHWYIVTNEDITNVTIEYPYRNLIDTSKWFKSNRARIDLCYMQNNVLKTAFEFKFHREVVTSTSCRTNNFGSVFCDFSRLSLLQDAKRLLVYVFDQEMYDYYKRKNVSLMLNASENSKFSSKEFSDYYNTGSFKDSATYCFIDKDVYNKLNYTVKVVHSHDFSNNFYLRVFEVLDE